MRCLLTLLSVLGSVSAKSDSRVISVLWDEGRWKVEDGVSADFKVVANLTETRTKSGWDHLDIRSRGDTLGTDLEDEEQALAAGIAEGYLSHNLILSYYREFIHKQLCSQVKSVLHEQHQYHLYNSRMLRFATMSDTSSRKT